MGSTRTADSSCTGVHPQTFSARRAIVGNPRIRGMTGSDPQSETGGMFVSVEVITMLACAVSIIVAFVSGCGWLINRMDVRFDRMDARIDERFAIQDARIDEKFAAQDARIDEKFAVQDARIDERFARIDERFERIDERFLGVGHELGEIRIAIARLEGPPRRLIGLR
jgi:hypothetical protein